jgi:hypothetical protein
MQAPFKLLISKCEIVTAPKCCQSGISKRSLATGPVFNGFVSDREYHDPNDLESQSRTMIAIPV